VAVGCGGGDDGGEPPDEARSERTPATAPSRQSVDVEEIQKRLKAILTRPAQPAIEVPGQARPARPAIAPFRVRSVACPGQIEPRKGGRFRCRVDAGKAGTGTVRLTQLDARGRVFRFTLQQKQPGVTTTIKGTLNLDHTVSPSSTPTAPAPSGRAPRTGPRTYDLGNPGDVEEACKRAPEACRTYPAR